MSSKIKLAIILSHPTQYYSPWFQYMASQQHFNIKVFYLNDTHVRSVVDTGFKMSFCWDIPLLEGYEYEFIAQHQRLSWMLGFSLYQRVKAFSPDTVLMMGYQRLAYYQFLFFWNYQRCPIIFRGDSHRIFLKPSMIENIKRCIIAAIFKQFSAFLYVGKANDEYFKYHHVPREKLFYAPHAVDNDRFISYIAQAQQEALIWKKELGIPIGYRVILFAGKFEQKKRPIDLLQAFKKAKLSHTALLFVGAGDLERELKIKARDSKDIYFAPFQNQRLMPRTYALADVFVLPSYGAYETWGLAVNEAMCMKKPVIVSHHTGCARDLIKEGHNGFVFKAGDIDDLSLCLQKVCALNAEREVLGENAQKHIRFFSYETATKGLCQAIDFLQSKGLL